MERRAAIIATLPLLVGVGRSRAAADDNALVARLREGRVAVLLRHSITDPGIGDPPEFKLDACSTQRNLSAEGRAQAQRIGAWFNARGLVPARVRSSAWCRCLDTGMLAFRRAEPWPALNSFFGEASAREQQSAALAAALAEIAPQRFEVWVTHQVNITALTTEFAAMGEACLVESAAPSGARVIARSRFGG